MHFNITAGRSIEYFNFFLPLLRISNSRQMMHRANYKCKIHSIVLLFFRLDTFFTVRERVKRVKTKTFPETLESVEHVTFHPDMPGLQPVVLVLNSWLGYNYSVMVRK